MESNYSWKRTEDIEIDLIDLLRRLCAQWKQILICAVVFAVLAGAYSYTRSGGTDTAAAPEDTEEIELEEEELRSVEAAVIQTEEIQGLQEYMENSVLMQMDPYHRNTVTLLFGVSQADRQAVQRVMETYLNFIQNGGAAEAVQASGGWEKDKTYLAELVGSSGKVLSGSDIALTVDGIPLGEGTSAEDRRQGEAVIYITVTGMNAEAAEQLAEDMQSALEAYSSTVRRSAGEHVLTLLDSSMNTRADTDLQALQHSRRSLLRSYTDELKAMTDAFSDDQMAVYEEIAGLAEEEEADAETAVTASGRGISKKYVLLGLVGGIFIYCCIYACLYLFRDTLKSTEEIKGLYTFPFYGGVSLGEKAKQSGAYEQELAQVLNRVRLACKNQEITRLCIASDFAFGAQEKECIEGVTRQLKDWGIDTITAEKISSDTTVWDTLTEIGTVLMVCKIGTTTHRMVDEEMSFYLENDIAVVGAVAFTLQ